LSVNALPVAAIARFLAGTLPGAVVTAIYVVRSATRPGKKDLAKWASGDRVQVREKQAIKHVERAAPRIGEMGGMLANPGGSSRITVP
jgi:hypothetical protein